MHNRAEHFHEGAAYHAIVPPHHLSLQRFKAGQRKPTYLPFVHPVDRCGGKAGDRQIMDHTLEATTARSAQLARDCQLSAGGTAIFLCCNLIAILRTLHVHTLEKMAKIKMLSRECAGKLSGQWQYGVADPL